MNRLIGACAAACLLTACTIDPHTGKRTFDTSGWGFGKDTGRAAETRQQPPAVTAADTGPGGYMDRQEARLRAQLQGSGVQVQREGNNVKVIIPGSLTFASNSADIDAASYPTLDALVRVLNEFGDTTLDVVGFTDAVGGSDLNQRLSKRRADSVVRFLLDRGIDRSRVVSRGMGERYPIAPNDSEGGRAQNRRVEVNIIPRG